jgi:tRNA dimethylallyltransferase
MSPASGHVVAIMGATATGKTEVAIQLAEEFAGEIVSMDSRQVYRGLDIGTAKPSRAQQQRVRHHLIDTLDPMETNSAGHHLSLVEEAIADIRLRGKLPFLVGGTGLYFRAFFRGLIDVDTNEDELKTIREGLEGKTTAALYAELCTVDPVRARELSPNDRVRISRALEVCLTTGRKHSEYLDEHRRAGGRPFGDDLRIVLTLPRSALRERIAQRTGEMFRNGWVEELGRLLASGCHPEAPAMNSLGYRSIADAVGAGTDPLATTDAVITLTQQYAKRQETFFRSIPEAHWVDIGERNATDKLRSLVVSWSRL